MAAFFGIDEFNAHSFIDKSILCISRKSGGKLDLQLRSKLAAKESEEWEEF